VREIHEEYVKAGAEILETNTYGASRPRLETFGLAGKPEEINRAGVKLARRGGGREGGCLRGRFDRAAGVRIEPLGPTSFAEARAHFEEQAAALAEAGVDLLLLETFGSVSELREALAAARRRRAGHGAGGADDDRRRRTSAGRHRTGDFTRFLDESPADVIGLNCSVGPKAMFEAVERMLALTKQAAERMPNAGHPDEGGGAEHLSEQPRSTCRSTRGGCCGRGCGSSAAAAARRRSTSGASGARRGACSRAAVAAGDGG
jgi:methionine synthase / methylenetetrahydrofolate reductase(NADPH)